MTFDLKNLLNKRLGSEKYTTMRKIITLILTAASLQVNSALAISGGPWDYGNAGSNQNLGNYEGVIKMKNGNGLFRFSQGLEAQISVFNVSTVFYRGIIYFGSCFASVNSDQNRVSGMTNGSSEGFSSQTTSNDQTAGFVTFQQTEETTEVSGLNSSSGGNIGTCNTSWEGKVTSKFPFVVFEAKGKAYFFGQLDQIQISTSVINNEIPVISTGEDSLLTAITAIIGAFTVPGTTNPISDITFEDLLRLLDLTTTSRAGTVENRIGSGGQSNVFPDIGVQEKIRVYGTQISSGPVAPVTDGFTLTGTGSGGFLF